MTKYIVGYAKLVDDKDMGALLVGVFLGGVCQNFDEAEALATRCASESQGGVIIPKVIPMHDMNLCSMMKEIEAQFDIMAEHIYENEAIAKHKR